MKIRIGSIYSIELRVAINYKKYKNGFFDTDGAFQVMMSGIFRTFTWNSLIMSVKRTQNSSPGFLPKCSLITL